MTFLYKVRGKIRFKHYSLIAENTYLSWIKQFTLYHCKRHPAGLGAAEVETFLTYLAAQRHVITSYSLRLCSGQAWFLRGENSLACIISDSKFSSCFFNARDLKDRAQRQPAIMIFEFAAYFDGFQTSPWQASKYGLSGTPTNRYGLYRS